jgi:hypothetical protein
MDLLSVAASITALAEAAAKLVEYLHDVKDGGKQRLRLSAEVSALWLVLESVKEQVEQWPQNPKSGTRKYIELLVQTNGPLQQSTAMLDQLTANVYRGLA